MTLFDHCLLGKALDGELVIDAHGHMGDYYDFFIPQNDAAGMLRSMDNLGIDQIWTSGHACLCASLNAGNEEVRDASEKWPDRFRAYLTINPHFAERTRAMLENAEVMGFDRIKLHPSCHDYPVDGDLCAPVWEYANDRGLIVLIHTWHGDARCDPALFEKLAERYPKALMLLGHSGGTFDGYTTAIRVCHARPNVYLDLTGSGFLEYGVIEHFARHADVDRLLYGSDMPFISANSQLSKILAARIDDETKRKILGGNAKALERR